MKRIVTIAVAMVIIMCLTGCSQKEIQCPAGGEEGITVRFMWDDAPEANPEGLTLMFYPLWSGGQIWRFDIKGREGGEVALPAGRYALLAFNNDLPGVEMRYMDNYNLACACLKVTQGVSRGCGHLYSGTVEEIEVTPCGVNYRLPDGSIKDCPYGLVRCYVRPLGYRYTVVCEDVDNLTLVRSVRARLSGMSEMVSLAAGLCEGEECGLAMTLSPGAVEMISGSAVCFGPSVPEGEFELAIEVTRTDGVTVAKTFDVTRQVITAQNPRDVVIRINGLDVPAEPLPPGPGGGDVGIDVGVDGWKIIEIDITS